MGFLGSSIFSGQLDVFPLLFLGLSCFAGLGSAFSLSHPPVGVVGVQGGDLLWDIAHTLVPTLEGGEVHLTHN